MKSTYRIGGALAVGIVIILGALYMKDNSGANSSGTIVVAPASTRTAILTQDSDGNGTQDWEENLQARVYKTIDTPTSTISLQTSEPYTPPTTLTGKFSEAFFQDYMEGKMQGQDFSNPTAFVNTAVTAIEQNAQSKRHAQTELTIIADSPETIRNYGNEVAEMLKTHSIQNEREIVILEKALSANDPKKLEALEPIRVVYDATIVDMLLIPVPLSLVQAHLNLLNAFEAILMDVEAMQVAFEDPLRALARAKGYLDDSQQLFSGFQGISILLVKNNITYTNDEPGVFFSFFNI